MASYTYPVAVPTGALTTSQIHLLLQSPQLIARRVADLTKMRFVADYLLSGRYSALGGGLFYDTGEQIFAADSPEAVSPGAEYPKTVLTQGEIAAAKTVKWGIETDITDEKISQQGITIVNKALVRLSNTVVRHVDSVAMAVIASKVASTFASPAPWTTAGKVIEALTSISGQRADAGTGLDLQTVVLKPAQYAKLIGMLVDDKALPREQGNIAITGSLPVDALGFTWVTTPFYTGTDPLLIDRDQLGGVADEKLGSPGYATFGGSGVETKADRHRDDKYELRARRVVVPVVTEPLAGVRITNTGL
ncbi:hypothetical protein E3T37_03585 [Cryobacterium sp. TMT2-10]|uniref:phage major capsid protein n=1 Tax=Cryobacterium sp. TMT2-10 TaxID=1259244 RepID=UPI00106CBE3B|nr:hypothetical protein [Cryobacterium sp. TMT2-10]TFD41746.1 hypothetical protein E3T37_03585 [Cryobacterium sp. TMT2-10]